jgi:hypothetical protein
MVTTAVDRVLVDTNVLVYACLRNSPWHARAIQALHTELQCADRQERVRHSDIAEWRTRFPVSTALLLLTYAIAESETATPPRQRIGLRCR